MFGQDDQHNVQDGGMPPMDPSVMADPSSLGQLGSDDGSSVAPYLNDDQQSVQPAVMQTTDPAPVTFDMPTQPQVQPEQAQPAAAPVVPDQPTDSSDNGLLSVKQDALNALSPLVGQLDQSPEEKFRTTMMMIQASDDRSLLKTAYQAAQSIEDPKMRAQALLDVINEINYFISHTTAT